MTSSVSVALGWTGGGIDELKLRMVRAVTSCQHCFTVPGLGLNSDAGLGLHIWKTAPTANVAVFGSRVTSVTLGIPNVNEGPSLSTTFDGSSITPSNQGS